MNIFLPRFCPGTERSTLEGVADVLAPCAAAANLRRRGEVAQAAHPKPKIRGGRVESLLHTQNELPELSCTIIQVQRLQFSLCIIEGVRAWWAWGTAGEQR